MFTQLFSLLSLSIYQKALYGCIILCAAAGMLSSLINMRTSAFLVHAFSHTIVLGAGIGNYVQVNSLIIQSIINAGIALNTSQALYRHQTIGMLMNFCTALGLYLVQVKGLYNVFNGCILDLGLMDWSVLHAIALCVIVMYAWIKYNQSAIIITCFDSVTAKIKNLNHIEVITKLFISLGCTFIFYYAGIVFGYALLIGPGSIAAEITNRIKHATSIVIALSVGILSYIFSLIWIIPMHLYACVILLLASIVLKYLKQHKGSIMWLIEMISIETLENIKAALMVQCLVYCIVTIKKLLPT